MCVLGRTCLLDRELGIDLIQVYTLLISDYILEQKVLVPLEQKTKFQQQELAAKKGFIAGHRGSGRRSRRNPLGGFWRGEGGRAEKLKLASSGDSSHRMSLVYDSLAGWSVGSSCSGEIA